MCVCVCSKCVHMSGFSMAWHGESITTHAACLPASRKPLFFFSRKRKRRKMPCDVLVIVFVVACTRGVYHWVKTAIVRLEDA